MCSFLVRQPCSKRVDEELFSSLDGVLESACHRALFLVQSLVGEADTICS